MSDHPYREASEQAVIDLVTLTRDGEINLIMIDDREWDGRQERLEELQAKINAYLAFALDGAMKTEFPESEGRRVVIQLDCSFSPDELTLTFLEQANVVTQQDGISIRINVRHT